MPFEPERAEIRFGCGLSPQIIPVQSTDELLARLSGPDHAAAKFPIADFESFRPTIWEHTRLRRKSRKAKTELERAEAKSALKQLRRQTRDEATVWFGNMLLRRALSLDPFRERLVGFWSDHFTAVGKSKVLGHAHLPYAEQAIRPHLMGSFADMLKAVIRQPLMLAYLDQNRSMGPASIAVKKSLPGRGLNENLARELLELHTLGVNGPYGQHDVRQLAELLTGLSYTVKRGFVFRPNFAEPGAETVLGVRYGGEKGQLTDILAAADDLARHPATAHHLAGKMAVHFVSDSPDPDLVRHMTKRFLDSDGNLGVLYAAMLEHSGAWANSPGNVKQPIDFVGSALRALDIVPKHLPVTRRKLMRNAFHTPMALMGQPWGRAPGPDGWPEADTAWITPQRLAARLQWAMTVPFSLRRLLPDPREFVSTALGSHAPESLRFAAGAAESRAEGIALVLASPAFQRS